MILYFVVIFALIVELYYVCNNILYKDKYC